MRLKLLWVGKTQEAWVKAGIEEYAGRVRRYCPLEILEAREEKGAQAALMRERECERLARLIPKGGKLVVLDERGEAMSSPELAGFLSKSRDQGTGDLVFAIGGAFGFTDAFRSQAFKSISLSRMTLTHQMVRVFLLELIYRGFSIMNGEPYHHE